MSLDVVLVLPRWSFAWIVKEAAVPAVASERPDPVPVETAPDVCAGKMVAVKGLPATAAVVENRRPEGTPCADPS
jgi:hypothetical protein